MACFSEKFVCTILCHPKSRALKTFFLWLVMATFQYGKIAILLYGNNRAHTDRVFNVTKASLLEITQNYIRFNPRNWETWRERRSLRILDSSGGRSLLLTPLYLWVIVMMIWFWSCLPFYFLIKSNLLLSNLIQSMLTDRILCVLTWRPFRILSSSSLLPPPPFNRFPHLLIIWADFYLRWSSFDLDHWTANSLRKATFANICIDLHKLFILKVKHNLGIFHFPECVIFCLFIPSWILREMSKLIRFQLASITGPEEYRVLDGDVKTDKGHIHGKGAPFKTDKRKMREVNLKTDKNKYRGWPSKH